MRLHTAIIKAKNACLLLVAILITSLMCVHAQEQQSSSGVENKGNAGLVYADFETMKDNRPVSSRGGFIQLISYQETQARPSKFKGVEGASPAAPELVRLQKDNPNRAAAFDYELMAPNEYAGVGIEIRGNEEKDGKSIADDVSKYKYLTLQVYATGAQSLRLEFISRGHGIESSTYPQTTFKVKPGFNTYKIALNSIAQPPWAQVKVDRKDVLKKMTAVSLTAYCNQCTQTRGTVVVDNLVFEN